MRPLFTILLYLNALNPHFAMTCSSKKMLNQRVLITGGGRGIGRAVALICSREGAKVAITSRTHSELEETAAQAHSGADSSDSSAMSMHVADVTNVSQVEDAVQAIVEKWGGIDILINNAGGSQKAKGPLETLPSEDLRSILDLNVVGVHAVTSAVLRRAMLPAGSGKIVNISSRAGKVGLPNYSHYCASKFALEGMTAALAEEVKDKGIEINTVS
jgi:NAD(P)-dependent dehydrogenase (short-subunit alcohol dehydrogenase family)